jgi:predicted AAA+ superfamily ATPase
MLNQIKKLLDLGVAIENILFINLEDPRFINHLNVKLLEDIKNVYLEYIAPTSKPYIFLDEIQNIAQWEKWINKEHELSKSHIVLSGSNSSMLSSEIASSLSGRYLSIEVAPLSFVEYLFFKNITIHSKLELIDSKILLRREFENYLRQGGFPKTLEYKDLDKRDLLVTYKDSILLKDIVARYKLNNFYVLEEISAFLLSNSGIIQSVSKIKNSFKISYDMASSYLEYLQNAYMIYEVKKFSYSLKKQNINEKKYYSIDLGLSNIMRVPNLQTRGSDLETVVFLELKRRGYKVYYYKTKNNLECDFLLEKENIITTLIQVTKTLKNEKTNKRELSSFAKTIDELQLHDVKLLVITQDSSATKEYNGTKIEIINIIEWLVEKQP